MRRVLARAVTILSVTLVTAAGSWDSHAQDADSIRLTLDYTSNPGVGGWGALGGLAIAPDGQRIAYISTDGDGRVFPGNRTSPQYIWLKPVGGGAATRLPIQDLPRGVFDLAFSPDGQFLAFGSPQGIWRISIEGGAPTLICSVAGDTHGIDWGSDGWIVFSASDRIMRVQAAGGPPSELVRLRQYTFAANAELLRDGGAILFTQYPSNLVERPQVVVQRPDGSLRVVIANPGYAARYVAATKQIIYDREGRLFAVPFDARELRITGSERLLLDDVTETEWGQHGAFGVSSSGALMYATGRHGWREAAIVARDGARKSVGRVRGTTAAVRVSPDGTHMAFDGDGHIWIAEIGNPASVRQLSTGKADFGPLWTPDGQRIVFGRFAFVLDDASESIYWQRVDGRDEAELLISLARQPESWSAAGRQLSFLRVAGNLRSIWIYATDDGTSRLFRYVEPPSSRPASAFSPNGKWLAYEDQQVDASKKVQSRVYVESASQPGKRVAVPNATGGRPVWSPDGRELFFDAENRLFVVAVRDSGRGTPTLGDPVMLPITGFVQRGGQMGYDAAQRGYDVTSDGQHFLMIFPAAVELAVIPKWTATQGGAR